MKLELKLISLILSLGFFSLPVQSQAICPGYQCPGGPCVPSSSDCPSSIVKFQGKLEYIYLLPPGTSYYCENNQVPQSSGTEGSSYFVCSLETSSRNVVSRKPTHFTSQTGTTYALGENTAFQCKTGEKPIQKGNVWSCPVKVSK